VDNSSAGQRVRAGGVVELFTDDDAEVLEAHPVDALGERAG
jgi:hypothetical protein